MGKTSWVKLGKTVSLPMRKTYITHNKAYYCFKDHLMLFTVKLRFLVHKGLQLQHT